MSALLGLVKTVPELSRSTGLRLTGEEDPGLADIPLPSAWVLLGNVAPNTRERAVNTLQETVHVEGVVMLYLPYKSQTDLISIQYPTLLKVVQAVRGSKAPGGHRWRFAHSRPLVIQPDRLGYELCFTAVGVL